MSDEIDLRKEFPGLMDQCWEVSNSSGWDILVRSLLTQLSKRDDCEELKVLQIKEKFGRLRFYVNYANEVVYELIDFTENLSAHICETCGSMDGVKTRGYNRWQLTLCKKCDKEKNENNI